MSINANTGVITGTPTATGTFTIVARVVDDLGGTDTQSYTLVIHQLPTIATTSLPNGQEGIAYNAVLDANLGTTPYTWAGKRPARRSLGQRGNRRARKPDLSGTFSVTITVTDYAARASPAHSPLDLNGGPSVGGTLPDWTVDRLYPDPQITGSSGTPPYTFSATGLPAGLSIGAGTGIVSGTPTASGAATVVVTVTDSLGGTSTQTYSLTINPAPNITTPGPLPDGIAGSAYPNTPLSRTGGTAPFTWSATGLPTAMSIDPGTGVISARRLWADPSPST